LATKYPTKTWVKNIQQQLVQKISNKNLVKKYPTTTWAKNIQQKLGKKYNGKNSSIL
jgi:hypothetical protein